MIMGTSGVKLFLYNRAKKLGAWLKGIFRIFWNVIRPHLLEYAVLLAIVIYAEIYFSYGVFQQWAFAVDSFYFS